MACFRKWFVLGELGERVEEGASAVRPLEEGESRPLAVLADEPPSAVWRLGVLAHSALWVQGPLVLVDSRRFDLDDLDGNSSLDLAMRLEGMIEAKRYLGLIVDEQRQELCWRGRLESCEDVGC